MPINTLVHDDGGRSLYFKGKSAGDCAARALAIATHLDYKVAYTMLSTQHKRSHGKKTAREGIFKSDYEAVLSQLGFRWYSAPKFEGRKARFSDLPTDRPVIARMARHFTAVVNGVVHDTWDCRDKMVYGYWSK